MGKLKFKKIIAMGLALSLLLSFSGCSLFPLEEEDLKLPLVEEKVTSFKLHTVRRDSIVSEVTSTGSFNPMGSSDLSFGVDGKISSIKVGFGSKVTAGQVLAELADAANIEMQVMMQESAVANAKSNYEKDASAANKQAYDTEQNKLNELKAKLNKARIVAPFSGTISYMADVKRNSSVKAGNRIFSISSNKSFVVHAPTPEYASFDIGMRVDCDYNGTVFKGTVVFTPDETPGSEKEYGLTDGFKGVVVSLDKVPDTAKIGDTISVKKVLASKDNVLVVPKSTVMEYDGKYFVFVWQNGIRVEREISVGLASNYSYEVISGLDGGEQITY